MESTLLNGNVKIISTLERGSGIHLPELTKMLSREIRPKYMSWGSLLVEFTRFSIPENLKDMTEKEALRAMTPELPDGINVVDNLSDTLYIVNNAEKIRDPIPIFDGIRSSIWSSTESIQQPYGSQWCHCDCDCDNYTIVNMADKLYNQENVEKVYLVLQTVPMLISYVPKKDEFK